MAQPSSKTNAFSTSHTRLAAALAAMGFPFTYRLRHFSDSGKDQVEFMFGTRSKRALFAEMTVQVATSWERGILQSTQPMHPLCVMMRANHNYDGLLDLQKGRPQRLISVAGGQMTEFRPGCELPSILALPRDLVHADLSLTAALAGVGIPPVWISGTHPRHQYHLPRHGFTLKDATGLPIMHDALHLTRRSPLPDDPQHLSLEDEQPLHPVCLAYDVLTVRAELKALIMQATPSLVLVESGMQAEISMNYTGRVMQRVAARFGTVPVL